MGIDLSKKENIAFVGLAILIVLVGEVLSFLIGRDIVEKKVDETRRILRDGLGNFGVLMEVGAVVLPIISAIGIFMYTGIF